ncbi:MAG: hypothetical protein AAGA03_08100 [Planctomycetota bacterium]
MAGPNEIADLSNESANGSDRRLGLLACGLPIVAGILFTFTLFQNFNFRIPLLTLSLMASVVLIWLAGIVSCVFCFVYRRWRVGCLGLFLSLVAVPATPPLMVMAVSPDARQEFAKGSLGLADEIAAVFDDGSARFASVDDVSVTVSPGGPSFTGTPIEQDGVIAIPTNGIPVLHAIWTADGSYVYLLASSAGSGNGYTKVAAVRVNDGECTGRLALATKSHVSVTQDELLLVPNNQERVILCDPTTLAVNATLKVRDAGKGWVATHPTQSVAALSTGGIESARLMDLPSRSGLGILERSDYPTSSTGRSSCRVAFGEWAFSEDGSKLMSASWSSPNQRNECDAFLEVTGEGAKWLGFRSELSSLQKVRPFDNRFRSYVIARDALLASTAPKTHRLHPVDGKLNARSGGLSQPVKLSSTDQSEPTGLDVVSVSPTGEAAVVKQQGQSYLVRTRDFDD